MIFWYQIFYFLISENDFLISRNPIFDIKKSSLFSGIKNSISWYQEIVFWYHKFEFLISENDFLKSKNLFLISIIIFWYQLLIIDIKKSNFWYQKNHFLITENTSKILKQRLIGFNGSQKISRGCTLQRFERLTRLVSPPDNLLRRFFQ